MQKENVPIYKKWWFWLITLFSVMTVFGAVVGVNEAKEDIAEGTVKEEEKSSGVEEEEELSTDDLIEKAVKDELGEDSIIKINRPEDHEDKFVLIKAYAKDSLSTAKSSAISMHTILKELDGVEGIGTVDFNLVAPLIDKKGNEEDSIIIKASYDEDTRDEINWDNFLWNDMDVVAESYWEHPALSK